MNIKIYTTPTCPYCNQEKEYMQSKGIAFQAIDVSQDEKARDEMMAKTGALTVPVTVIEKDGKEDIIIGFDKDRLDKLIS
ncbi:MAG TPA: glutaredoxin domain-containing protein [Candidatus Babeliales bacterium]|nr:glutaredoxin domain-containing protein [Candidatus Babeliales bacterium]